MSNVLGLNIDANKARELYFYAVERIDAAEDEFYDEDDAVLANVLSNLSDDIRDAANAGDPELLFHFHTDAEISKADDVLKALDKSGFKYNVTIAETWVVRIAIV